MDSTYVNKKTTNKVGEMNKLLYDLEKSKPGHAKETLKIMSKLVSTSKNNSYFYRLGGIKKILKFMENNEKDGTAMALSILGSCALNNKRCQAELAANEKIFDILSKVLEEANPSDYTLVTFAMILISSIVAKSDIGQSLVRESMCLYRLVVLFLHLLELLDFENMDNENRKSIFSAWETLCVTVKKCVNDPRCEINQHQVTTIIPKSIQFLEECFQSGKKYDCSAKYVETLLSMLIHVVSCNLINQTNFAAYSGMHIIISGITILENREMPSCSNSVQEKLVQLLDATISDNCQNCISVAAMGGIPILLQLLSRFKNKQKVSVLITLTHLLENCDTSRVEFVQLSGFSSVVLATLNMEEHPEVGQAANCLIKFCAKNLATSTCNMMEGHHNLESLADWIDVAQNSQITQMPETSSQISPSPIIASKGNGTSAGETSALKTDTSNFNSKSEAHSKQTSTSTGHRLNGSFVSARLDGNRTNQEKTMDDKVFVKPKQMPRYNTSVDRKSDGPMRNYGFYTNSQTDDAHFLKSLTGRPINVKSNHRSSRQQRSRSCQSNIHEYVERDMIDLTFKRGKEYAASDVGPTGDHVDERNVGCHKEDRNDFRVRTHTDRGGLCRSTRLPDNAAGNGSYVGYETFREGVIYAGSEVSYGDQENVGTENKYNGKNINVQYVGHEASESMHGVHGPAGSNVPYTRGQKRAGKTMDSGDLTYPGSAVGSRRDSEYAHKDVGSKRGCGYAGSSVSSQVRNEYAQSHVGSERSRGHVGSSVTATRVHSKYAHSDSEYARRDVGSKRARGYVGSSVSSRVHNEYAQSDVGSVKGCGYAASNVSPRIRRENSFTKVGNTISCEYTDLNAGHQEQQKCTPSITGSRANHVHTKTRVGNKRSYENGGKSILAVSGVHHEYVHSNVGNPKGCKNATFDGDFLARHEYAGSAVGYKECTEYATINVGSRSARSQHAPSNIGNKQGKKYAGSIPRSVASRAYAESNVECKVARVNVKTRQRNSSVRGGSQLSGLHESTRATAGIQVNVENSSRKSCRYADKGEPCRPPVHYPTGKMPEHIEKTDQICRDTAQFSTREVENLQDGVSKFGMNFKKICKSYDFKSKTSHDLYKRWKSCIVID